MSERRKVRVGYVKDCDLRGACSDGCSDLHATCKDVAVLLVPIDEVEMEMVSVEGRLQFGNMLEVAPWTDRKISADLTSVKYPISVTPQKRGG